jgi:hypothetical protein
MIPAYIKAFEGFKSACHSSTTHPNDFARIVHMLKKLTEAGKFVSHPDVISEYLKQQNFSDYDAEKIQSIYEVFESVAKDSCGWSEDFIADVINT